MSEREIESEREIYWGWFDFSLVWGIMCVSSYAQPVKLEKFRKGDFSQLISSYIFLSVSLVSLPPTQNTGTATKKDVCAAAWTQINNFIFGP